MQDIVIIGAGGHAKVVIDIIEKEGKYNIIGLIDSYNDKKYHFGYKILGTLENESLLRDMERGIIAIGDNWSRYIISAKISSVNKGFKYITCISPNAYIARGVIIEEGSVVMSGAIINSDTIIGRHCIINNNASIDHENVIGDYVSIAPSVTTGGNVSIGNYTAIGLGTNIIHKTVIGENTVVGAGSTVIKNISNFKVAYGTPCKVVRDRSKGDKYL